MHFLSENLQNLRFFIHFCHPYIRYIFDTYPIYIRYIFDKRWDIYGINSEKVMNKYKCCKYENYIKHTKPTTYNQILFFMANGHIFYRKVFFHFIMCGSSERRAMCWLRLGFMNLFI